MLRGQSLSLFDTDATSFPKMKAKFFALDSSGVQQSPTIKEFSIQENGVVRAISNISCPSPLPPKALSSVLVIDVSGSMGNSINSVSKMLIAKTAARKWVNNLLLDRSECAITSFDGFNYLNQDFTTDRSRLLTAIDKLEPRGGTDYSAALVKPAAGGLIVSNRGKHQRVIVFLTDGQPDIKPDVNAIVAEANRQNCMIFCVTLDLSAPQSVKDIASRTGGQTFENITTAKGVEDVYEKILLLAQGGYPCTIEWQSGTGCTGMTSVELTWNRVKSQGIYTPPNNAIASLQVTPTPTLIAFGKRLPATKNDTTITLTAQNGDFVITGINRISGSADFTVINTTFPLVIPKNISKTLTLRFSPTDSSMKYTCFEIQSDLCPTYFSTLGGFSDKRVNTLPLKLTSPNGGETLVVGGDTVITWEGVSPTDTVMLEYSSDKGRTWNLLTNKATGLRYTWKNIPKPPGGKCLVRVKQNGTEDKPSDAVAIMTLSGHKKGVLRISYNPQGNKIASASMDEEYVRVWDSEKGDNFRLSWAPRSTMIQYKPDGSKLLISRDNTLEILDAFTDQLVRSYGIADKLGVYDITFSPNGNNIISVGGDSLLKVWDTDSASLLKAIQTHHNGGISAVAYSPDGRFIATSAVSGAVSSWTPLHRTIKIWDANTGNQIKMFDDLSGGTCLAYSPDGYRLAVCNKSGMVKIWDVNKDVLIRTLQGKVSTDLYNRVTYSPDGSKLATASTDGTAKIWDAETGALIRTFIGHGGAVNDVSFSPDGSKLATASDDKTIKIWDVEIPPLQEDISDSVFSIVVPNPASQDVDMLQCLVGDNKDSLVTTFITNKGAYPFRVDSISIVGSNASQFRVVSGIPPFVVPANDARSVEFRFTPTSVGIKTAQILIYTQTDTLRQTIQGEGITPRIAVLNTLIDFGQVSVGRWNDTLDAVTIKNVGNTSITIKSTRHAGLNDMDFTTLAGGGSFTLNVGDTARLDLRFMPKYVGRTSGRLLFDYDDVGSPATVQLFGEGIKRSAQITAFGVTVPPLTCATEKTDTIRIRNTGTDTLRIHSVSIGGLNNTDFKLGAILIQDRIIPDGILLLPIRFTPTAIGDRVATLELRSNSERDSILLLTLVGRKENTDFSVLQQIVDVGVLCPDETKDTTITVRNIGTIDNTLNIQSPSLETTTTSVVLQSGEYKNIQLRFRGRTNDGNIDEVLTLRDGACGVEQSVRVIGQIQRPRLWVDSLKDFGIVGMGKSSTMEVIAVNRDSRPLVLDNIHGIQPPFVLQGITHSAGSVIQPNDTVRAVIKYSAEISRSISKIIWSIASPCVIRDSTELRGGVNPDTVRTLIRASDIVARAGEPIELTLSIAEQRNLGLLKAPREYHARLRLNGTIVYIPSSLVVCEPVDEHTCDYVIQGRRGESDTLLSLKGYATLGNSDYSQIEVREFVWVDTTLSTEVETRNGSIQIVGLCEEGGVRLVIPTGKKTSLACRPNPAKDAVRIEYSIIEPLRVTIEIINIQGQVVATPIPRIQHNRGAYIADVDITNLSSGVYYVRMTTASGVLTSRMDVVK
jgi:WD40 repeat protein/uncharacterized protein YegL